MREIFEQLKKKNRTELSNIFNEDSLRFIQLQLEDCNTGAERVLLEIIQFVAEIGINIIIKNQFYENYHNSGLMNKIENLIKKQVDQKEKEINYQPYSETVAQLIRIYLMIMKYQITDSQMIDICVKILEINLSILINKLKNFELEKKQENQNELKKNNEELEKDLIRSISTIQAIAQFRANYERFADQIIKLLEERLIPFIHLNCEQELKCPHHITFPNSKSIKQFITSIFQQLTIVSMNDQNLCQYLIDNHNILSHFTYPIVSFANSYQYNQQYNLIQQQLASQYSLKDISSSIDFLKTIIKLNKQLKSIIPNILLSLIKLLKYNINIHFNKQSDECSIKIRNESRNCLQTIQQCGDDFIQTQLANSEYPGSLSILITTAGGSEEENDTEISSTLFNIQRFIEDLHKGRSIYNFFTDHPAFPPQPMLAKLSNEQIEEEGGLEEIEAQLSNKESYNRFYSKEAKYIILNIFTDHTNPKSYWNY